MSLQAKMAQPHDPRLYSPNRDVAHNFDYVIMEVAKRCELQPWSILQTIAMAYEVSQEDLGRACQCLCLFVMTNTADRKESMAQGLSRCGFFDLKPAARVIVMTYMGTIALGMHWAGVRETTLGGNGPLLDYHNLVSHGRRLMILMRMPGWKRWLHRLRWRIRKARAAFFKNY